MGTFNVIPAHLAVLLVLSIQWLSAQSSTVTNHWAVESTVFWESHYVDSGRDDIEDSGIFSAEIVSSYEAWSVGTWLGIADRVHYQELNVFAAYGVQLAAVDLEFAYTHLEFDPDSGNDDELSIAAETELIGGWVIAGECVYSFEAVGSFLEVGFAYPLVYDDERLYLRPSLHAGFDYGYRSEAYDGLNHIQISIDFEYALTERYTLIAYVAHSYAQDDIEQEGLGDVSWGGIGLKVGF
jgi:hypothetical protein